METLVVIPYLASAAQGNELRLAVEGWRQHFKEPHHIVIVGDCPDWLMPKFSTGEVSEREVAEAARRFEALTGWASNTGRGVRRGFTFGDLTFINCPRIVPVPGEYTPHLDIVHKFREVRKHFPESKGFIYTCDDIYATADFTLDEVRIPKHPETGPYIIPYDWKSNAADWWSDRGKTAELCYKEGIPTRDWVCHLPVYYEWDKLIEIYDKYDCDHVSYIVENIYFGLEYGAGLSYPAKDYRDEVKSANPGGIRPVGSVPWITNQNCGWSKKLEDILMKHYGLVL